MNCNLYVAEVIDFIDSKEHKKCNNSLEVNNIICRRILDGIECTAKPINTTDIVVPTRFELVLLVRTIGNNNIDKYDCNVNVSDNYYYIYPINVWNLINYNILPLSSDTFGYKIRYEDNDIEKKLWDDATKENIGIPKNVNVKIPKLRFGDKAIIGRYGQLLHYTITDDKDSNTSTIYLINNTKTSTYENTYLKDIKVNDINNAYISTCNSKILYEFINNSFRNFKDKPNNTKKETQQLFKSNVFTFIADNYIHFDIKKFLGTCAENMYLDISKNSIITTDKFELNADTNVSVKCNKIELGNNPVEPAVLGQQLLNIINQLLTAIETITVICTAPGTPSTPPVNIPQFESIRAQLNNMLSKVVKIK